MDDIEQKLNTALEEYFRRDKKFIDTSRIPLICQDIANIHARIEKIDSNITWITRTIIGAVVLGLIGLLISKNHVAAQEILATIKSI